LLGDQTIPNPITLSYIPIKSASNTYAQQSGAMLADQQHDDEEPARHDAHISMWRHNIASLGGTVLAMFEID
jgi:hypothetical protein